jgi:hypothetical protein
MNPEDAEVPPHQASEKTLAHARLKRPRGCLRGAAVGSGFVQAMSLISRGS